MYFEYETPVWSLVMMWSTPSSRNDQVVARSADAGGMGKMAFEGDAMVVVVLREKGGSLEACQTDLFTRFVVWVKAGQTRR
jgi:hypothetical protein